MIPRILHVNNVANVPQNINKSLSAMGIFSEIYQPKTGTYRANLYNRILLPFSRTYDSFKLAKYVREKRFNIIHIHYGLFGYLALLTGMPYFLHCHGSDINLCLRIPVLRQLVTISIRKAIKVFCSTPDLVLPISKIRKDVEFIPNPIDTSRFSPKPVKPGKRLNLISISKLDKTKGIDKIIEAINIMEKENFPVDVSVFSFGNSEMWFKSLLEKYPCNNLNFLHRIPYSEMPALINSFDAVIGQVSSGAIGMSELESMACGKPVISSFKYPDSYSEKPPLLYSDTPVEIVESVAKLISQPELIRDIGHISREWIMKYHDSFAVTQKLLQYYS